MAHAWSICVTHTDIHVYVYIPQHLWFKNIICSNYVTYTVIHVLVYFAQHTWKVVSHKWTSNLTHTDQYLSTDIQEHVYMGHSIHRIKLCHTYWCVTHTRIIKTMRLSHVCTLWNTATHCNTLQHTAALCALYSTLLHTATQCNKLQHSATHRSTLR